MISRASRLLTALMLACLLTAIGLAVHAGTTGIISGFVTDADTGARLSGVNIVVKGTKLTTVTDDKGYFVITNVPPGSYEVKASLVGYGDEYRSDVQVTMDTTIEADIELEKIEIEATDVVVKKIRKLTQPDVAPTLYLVSPKQEQMAKNQPNYLYQIAGAVGTQPGITVDPDGKPHIRGGRDNEVGYMVEGIPVVEPLTNIFGTNMVTVGMSKMQVYTGGYRAEYGNAISGVFNEIKKTGSEAPGGRLEMTGGNQSYAGSYIEYGGVSPSGFDYYIGSYLWKTTFERQFVRGGESADTVGKFVYPHGKDKWTLLLNQGSARYYLDSIHDFTYLNQPVPPENDHTHQAYDIIGLTWSRNFSPSSFINVRPFQLRTRNVADALAPDGPMGTYMNYGVTMRGIQMDYTNQINDKHLFKTGASIIRSNNRYMAWVPGLGEMFGFPEWGDYTYTSNVDTVQTGLFIQDQAKLSDKWRAEVGLRYDAMKFDKVNHPDTKNSQFSPRLGLTYTVDSRNVLKGSWGKFIQFPPSYVMERDYENDGWISYRPENLELKPERSTSWDISWERQIDDNTLFRLTPFYRNYTDLLQSQQLDPDDPESMTSIYINSGKGKSKGVEMYLSKRLSDKWEGWLSYTWMRSKANASAFNAPIDPSLWTYVDWDQRHTLNVVAAYHSGKWQHDFQLYYGSGFADTVNIYTAEYQKHGQSAAVLSWNISRELPEDSKLGNKIFLNVWNVFNTGKVTRNDVNYDGTKEPSAWIVPRFITMGVVRNF